MMHPSAVKTVCAIILAVGVLSEQTAASSRDQVRRVVSLYVVTLSNHAAWEIAGREDVFLVGVVGDPGMIEIGNQIAKDKQVHGRPVKFVAANPNQAASWELHAVFLDLSADKQVDGILRAVADKPILTFGMVPYFVRRGGMIGLVPAGRKMSYEVNTVPAARVGIAFSPKITGSSVGR